MHYHQATTNQTKMNKLEIIPCYKYELMRPGKVMVNLANLKIMFGRLFEEIEFTANSKSSIKVSPYTTAMQKIQTYIHGSFFCPVLICHHSINASNCSNYCN